MHTKIAVNHTGIWAIPHAAGALVMTGPASGRFEYFCGSDIFAYGAMFECVTLGMRVPDDISITGFDDMWMSSELPPGLTTVRTPRHDMGALAGRYLFSKLNGEDLPPPRALGFELIVRGSTAPPAVRRPRSRDTSRSPVGRSS